KLPPAVRRQLRSRARDAGTPGRRRHLPSRRSERSRIRSRGPALHELRPTRGDRCRGRRRLRTRAAPRLRPFGDLLPAVPERLSLRIGLPSATYSERRQAESRATTSDRDLSSPTLPAKTTYGTPAAGPSTLCHRETIPGSIWPRTIARRICSARVAMSEEVIPPLATINRGRVRPITRWVRVTRASETCRAILSESCSSVPVTTLREVLMTTFACCRRSTTSVTQSSSTTSAAVPSRRVRTDRKSTRLNSSHVSISYAVCCLKHKRYEVV